MAPPARAASFEAVHREFRPKVLRHLRRFVDADEAADLTQLTMLKVSEHLPRFRGDSSLATWIYRIATNVALDRLRQRGPEWVPIESDSACEADETVAAALQVGSAEAAAARNEMSACVREYVAALPEPYRAVLVLSELEGLANGEIADRTGVSLGTVKIRLHRARARLREHLQAGCTMQRDERNEVACERAPV